MTKVLVDTNIFIYALDADSVHFSKSMTILSNPQFQLYTTSKNISEYFAVTSKLRLSPKKVWEFYKDIRKNIEVIYPSDTSLKRFEKMIKKYQPKGNRIFDIEVMSVSLTANVKKVASFNHKDFTDIKGIVLIN